MRVYHIKCQSCGKEFGSFAASAQRCADCKMGRHNFGPGGFFSDHAQRQFEDVFKQSVKIQKDEPAIPPEMLKRLIYLCHPDKHADSETSRIATDWLLKQREKQNAN